MDIRLSGAQQQIKVFQLDFSIVSRIFCFVTISEWCASARLCLKPLITKQMTKPDKDLTLFRVHHFRFLLSPGTYCIIIQLQSIIANANIWRKVKAIKINWRSMDHDAVEKCSWDGRKIGVNKVSRELFLHPRVGFVKFFLDFPFSRCYN